MRTGLGLTLLVVIAGTAPAAADSWERDTSRRGCWAACRYELGETPRLMYGRWPICRGVGSDLPGINIRKRDVSYCRVEYYPGHYDDLKPYKCRCRQDYWQGDNGDNGNGWGPKHHHRKRHGRD
jgi:hypothetical protein